MTIVVDGNLRRLTISHWNLAKWSLGRSLKEQESTREALQLEILYDNTTSCSSTATAVDWSTMCKALYDFPTSFGSDESTRYVQLGEETLHLLPLEKENVGIMALVLTTGTNSESVVQAVQKCHSCFELLRGGGIHVRLLEGNRDRYKCMSEQYSYSLPNTATHNQQSLAASLLHEDLKVHYDAFVKDFERLSRPALQPREVCCNPKKGVPESAFRLLASVRGHVYFSVVKAGRVVYNWTKKGSPSIPNEDVLLVEEYMMSFQAPPAFSPKNHSGETHFSDVPSEQQQTEGFFLSLPVPSKQATMKDVQSVSFATNHGDVWLLPVWFRTNEHRDRSVQPPVRVALFNAPQMSFLIGFPSCNYAEVFSQVSVQMKEIFKAWTGLSLLPPPIAVDARVQVGYISNGRMNSFLVAVNAVDVQSKRVTLKRLFGRETLLASKTQQELQLLSDEGGDMLQNLQSEANKRSGKSSLAPFERYTLSSKNFVYAFCDGHLKVYFVFAAGHVGCTSNALSFARSVKSEAIERITRSSQGEFGSGST